METERICRNSIGYFYLEESFRIITSILYSLNSVSATALNYLILRVIWKTPSLRKSPSNILLASLALTDFLVGITAQPLMIIKNVAAVEKWRKPFCIVSIVVENLGMWLCSLSLGTLGLISIDRVLAVKLKSSYKTTVTAKRVKVVLIFWWALDSVFIASNAVALLHGIHSVTNILMCVGLFCLLFVIIFCYTLAFKSLAKITSSVSQGTRRAALPGTTPSSSSSAFNVSKYRKSLNTMLIILFTIMAFYLPYFGVTVVKLVIYQTDFWREFPITTLFEFIAVGELMVYLNSTINPLIYLWRFSDLRKETKNLFRCTLG